MYLLAITAETKWNGISIELIDDIISFDNPFLMRSTLKEAFTGAYPMFELNNIIIRNLKFLLVKNPLNRCNTSKTDYSYLISSLIDAVVVRITLDF